MGIKDYFSKNENKRANFIFNFIAPIYGKIAKKIAKNYDDVIDKVDSEVELKGKNVLDIGTGTGSWAIKFFDKKSKKVVGVDFAEKMILQAKKNYPEIEFMTCNAEKLEKISDKSFDISTASFVLHGVKKDRRAKILMQMQRVTKEHIIIHDFAGKVKFSVRILEALEQSDMPYFKDNFETELKEFFSKVKLIKLKKGGGIYIAKI